MAANVDSVWNFVGGGYLLIDKAFINGKRASLENICAKSEAMRHMVVCAMRLQGGAAHRAHRARSILQAQTGFLDGRLGCACVHDAI